MPKVSNYFSQKSDRNNQQNTIHSCFNCFEQILCGYQMSKQKYDKSQIYIHYDKSGEADLSVVDYSDASVALFAPETFGKANSSSFVEIDGKWNNYLKIENEDGVEESVGGWIFKKKYIVELFQKLKNAGILKGDPDIDDVIYHYQKKKEEDVKKILPIRKSAASPAKTSVRPASPAKTSVRPASPSKAQVIETKPTVKPTIKTSSTVRPVATGPYYMTMFKYATNGDITEHYISVVMPSAKRSQIKDDLVVSFYSEGEVIEIMINQISTMEISQVTYNEIAKFLNNNDHAKAILSRL